MPIKKGKVGMYSCGPTVYWNQHIGHMYAYVQWDGLVRLMRYQGWEVKWVMNITDVGHMVADEETGEDKMEKGARREGLTVAQIAKKYTDQFLESLDLLNIQRPDVLCQATEHIAEQIELIGKIEANGFAYKTRTGLVFDTGKFPRYAEFGQLNLQDQEAGARVEVDPQKKKPWDFLLWVTNQPNHVLQWDSPWGRGFPGWHIECTAMSVKYLGERFDIHTGGQEHIPVHHTNEIAQGYGVFRHQTANYWMHNGWLVFDGEKMSKSLGNNILVTDLMEKGFSPLALRYLVLTSHYRKGMNFTWSSLTAAQSALDKLCEFVKNSKTQNLQNSKQTLSKEKLKKLDGFRARFVSAVNNDLNFPQGLAVVWEMIKSNIPGLDKLELLLDWDQILGLGLANTQEGIKVPEEVTKLVGERESLRKAGKFVEGDKVRMQIEALGFTIKDTATGPVIKSFSSHS
ncbi:MAG: Cysteine-tRNA ligase [Candidatus Amesbacteria bacterium GW2011_GWA1_46_35]|nr:MAG: Cysteine-tRNA ligase [Candidatus Amesbacteria bacterium GW2011_GWA1_46_35]KKU69061.1 MAG: Cysteine-tRNA ligase [Microgenomates group bacterium GW2011_GWC1_47_20]